MNQRIDKTGRSEKIDNRGASAPASTSVGTPLDEQSTGLPRRAEVESTAHYEPKIEIAVDAAPGTVCGRFRVVKPHARGGLGEVYVADDTEVRRSVALKRIRRQYSHDPDSKARFLREAEITGNLEHPGIVPIYGVGTDADGQPYYAMRFIQGESLQATIARFHDAKRVWKNAGERQLELRKLLQRFLDVCNAMEYAHSRGVIHRDLKPANIMIGKYGETLVVDWGLAKPIGAATEKVVAIEPAVRLSADDVAATEMGHAIGTPVFMSPEQADGRHDATLAATDIYALGAILHAMLSGSPPVKGTSRAEVLEKVRQGKLESLPSGVAPPLVSICRTALALQPTSRYASARALADDVEKWLADERVAAHRESLGERAARWARTHRVLVASGLALTATAVVGLVLGLFFLSAEQRKTALEKQTAELRRQEADQERERAEGQRKLADEQRVLAEDRKTTADKERDRAEWTAYVAHIQAADSDWERNNIAGALAHLNACQPKWRGWEHDYLTAKFQRGFSSFPSLMSGQSGAKCIAYSPDGKLIAGGGNSGFMRVCDAETGALVRDFSRRMPEVNSVVFSRDGKKIVIGGFDKELKIMNIESGAEVASLKLLRPVVRSTSFNADESRLLTIDNDLKIWDIASGKEAKTISFFPNVASYAVYSPDGQTIAVGTMTGKIELLDAESGTPKKALSGHKSEVRRLVFSSDGKWLVSGSTDQTIKVWDVETGRLIHTCTGHTAMINDVALSRDEKRIVSASFDGTVRLWDIESGEQLRILRGHTGWVGAAAFDREGRHVVSGGVGVKKWNLETEIEADTLFNIELGEVWSFALNDDGTQLLSTVGDSITLWDLVHDRLNRSFRVLPGLVSPGAMSAEFCPDGKRFVGGHTDGVIRFWDLETGTQESVRGHHTREVRRVAYSPDGRFMVSGDSDNLIKLWNAATGEVVWSVKDRIKDLSSLSFSPDGKTLLVSGQDRSLALWDVATGAERHLLNGHPLPVRGAVFNRAGDRIASCGDVIKLWDAATGQLIRTFQACHDYPTAIAYSPDGKRIVSGHVSGLLRVWDVETGQEIMALRGHRGAIKCVIFTLDGRGIISGSQDKTVKLWDTRIGGERGNTN